MELGWPLSAIRLEGHQAGRFQVGFQPVELQFPRRRVIRLFREISLNSFFFIYFPGYFQSSTSHTQGHGCHLRAGVIEGLHHPAERLLAGFLGITDLRGAEDMVFGNAAVVERQGRRIGHPQPHLVFHPHQLQAGVITGDDKGFDRRLAQGLVQSRPDHHRVAALASSAVNRH